jgi:hypothetical protein
MKEGLKSRLPGFSGGGFSSREPSSNPGLHVTVISTTPVGTAAALNAAKWLGKDLGARITLLSFEFVQFDSSPDQPPLISECLPVPNVLSVSSSGGQAPDVECRICLCHEIEADLPLVLRRRALVLVGGKRRWWSTREQKLEKALRRAGHHVLFIDIGCEPHQASNKAIQPFLESAAACSTIARMRSTKE